MGTIYRLKEEMRVTELTVLKHEKQMEKGVTGLRDH